MADCEYKIAGLRIQMDSFGRTVTQAEPYRAAEPGEPDIVITSDPKQLQEKHYYRKKVRKKHHYYWKDVRC